MALLRDYHGVQYQIPEPKEKAWGPTVTALLASFCVDLDSLSAVTSGVPLLAIPMTTTTLTDGGTLTQTYPWHVVTGSAGPVTLSATTAIADGVKAGVLLFLTGGSYPVTILDGAHTNLNGDAILENGQTLVLGWNESESEWVEITRSF